MSLTLRERFFAFDAKLVELGVMPLSDWWKDGIGRWLDAYEQKQVLELWACVGRGAAKSTALYKLALFFTLFGDFKVPPGEIHYAAVISRIKEEAAKGVGIVHKWLDLLGIRHRLAGGVVELLDRPRGIRILAASVAATSGFRAFALFKDERSKWSATADEDLDASEVDTSAVAMTATHPRAPIVAFGSAWSMSGPFYEAIIQGSNDSRVCLGPAATWVAAPHLREEDYRKKEKDPRKFAREYLCTFQEGATSAFNLEEVNAAFEPRELRPLGAPTLCLDPSSGKGDTWAYGLVRWAESISDSSEQWLYEARYDAVTGHAVKGKLLRDRAGALVPNPDYHETNEPILLLSHLGGFEGRFGSKISGKDLVAWLAKFAKRHGVSRVVSDQREEFLLGSAFAEFGLGFTSYSWSISSKPEAYLHVSRLLREKRITFQLPTVHHSEQERAESIRWHQQARADLLSTEEKLMPSGAVTFTSKRSGGHHQDVAALVFTAAMADLEGDMRGSPLQVKRGVNVKSKQCGPV